MHDRGKVLIGIAIFLIVVLFPVWYSAASGRAGHVHEPDPKAKHPECVKPADWMRVHHMEFLDDWRDQVVREGDRSQVWAGATQWDKSLTRTCLGCHQSKPDFCDQCHDYVGVEPDCWDCHVVPGGN